MEATAAKLIGREKNTAATARRRSSDAADEGQHRAVVLQPLESKNAAPVRGGGFEGFGHLATT